ncbi:uncharacterized protein LOC143023083 [Oratosquilla oratoria]|uniref:uncharacterized protein LOC143023083 n=1 Tax=Oratosquilla oratoria TaxID=337810 RepID=UPI003F757818
MVSSMSTPSFGVFPTAHQSIQLGGMIIGGQSVLCLGCFGLFTTLVGVMALVTATSLMFDDWGQNYTDPSLVAGAILVSFGGTMLITSVVFTCLIKRRYRAMKETLTILPGAPGVSGSPAGFFNDDFERQYITVTQPAVAASFPTVHHPRPSGGSFSSACSQPPLVQQGCYTAPGGPPGTLQNVAVATGYPQGCELGFGRSSPAPYMFPQPQQQGYVDLPQQYTIHPQQQPQDNLGMQGPTAFVAPTEMIMHNDPMSMMHSSKAGEFTLTAGDDTAASAPPSYS